MLRAAVAALVLLAFGATPGLAQRRVALAIGIADYQLLRGMVRPAGDSQAVQQALARLGFEAEAIVNAIGRDLGPRVDQFVSGLQQDDVALVYFSGHGARGQRDFLLLPADAPAQRPEGDPPAGGTLGLHALADQITATGARAVFIIDACRGDPYAGGQDLGASSCGDVGAQMPEGSFVLFSASTGQKALDRTGPNDTDPHSLFTRVLLRIFDEARSVTRLARLVRDEVVETARAVNYDQRPAYLDELSGPAVLLSPRERDTSATVPPAAPSELRPQRQEAIIVEPPPGREQQAPSREADIVVAPAPRGAEPAPAPHPRSATTQCGSIRPGPPAFDCRAARGTAERVICLDPRLGSCDQVLTDVFERAQARVGRNAPALRRDEDVWVANRNACGRLLPSGDEALAGCIATAYEDRIGELNRIVAAPPPAVGPSFNCRRARTPVEEAICNEPRLAAKDREMAALFERALMFNSGWTQSSQGNWRSARDSCTRSASDPGALSACVDQVYDQRIRELRGVLAHR